MCYFLPYIYFFSPAVSYARVLFLNPWLRKQAFNIHMLWIHHILCISKAAFFSYEIYLYTLLKAQHFSLYYSCKNLKIGVQVRLPLTDAPLHTLHSLDIIVTENKCLLTTSFLMTLVLQPRWTVPLFSQKKLFCQNILKTNDLPHLKNQLLNYTLQVSWSQLIEHKEHIQILSLRQG